MDVDGYLLIMLIAMSNRLTVLTPAQWGRHRLLFAAISRNDQHVVILTARKGGPGIGPAKPASNPKVSRKKN
jgi:hypothetical protein